MYKLKVTAERIDGYCNQPILVGDSFILDGGKIMIPEGNLCDEYKNSVNLPTLFTHESGFLISKHSHLIGCL